MGKKFSGRYCTAEDDPMSESVRFHLENLPCNSDISNLDGGEVRRFTYVQHIYLLLSFFKLN